MKNMLLIRLQGSSNVLRFRSPEEFALHAEWLLCDCPLKKDQSPACGCHYCSGEKQKTISSCLRERAESVLSGTDTSSTSHAGPANGPVEMQVMSPPLHGSFPSPTSVVHANGPVEMRVMSHSPALHGPFPIPTSVVHANGPMEMRVMSPALHGPFPSPTSVVHANGPLEMRVMSHSPALHGPFPIQTSAVPVNGPLEMRVMSPAPPLYGHGHFPVTRWPTPVQYCHCPACAVNYVPVRVDQTGSPKQATTSSWFGNQGAHWSPVL